MSFQEPNEITLHPEPDRSGYWPKGEGVFRSRNRWIRLSWRGRRAQRAGHWTRAPETRGLFLVLPLTPRSLPLSVPLFPSHPFVALSSRPVRAGTVSLTTCFSAPSSHLLRIYLHSALLTNKQKQEQGLFKTQHEADGKTF